MRPRSRKSNNNDDQVNDKDNATTDQKLLPFKSMAQLRKPIKRSSEIPMKRYPMSGVNVEFPFQPYPAQIQMMSKIVKALKEKKNALLESPTGSGKSLAILCASLAWSEFENKRLLEEKEKLQKEREAELVAITEKSRMIVNDTMILDNNNNSTTTTTTNPNLKRVFSSDDDDFRPIKLPAKIIKLQKEEKEKNKSLKVFVDGEEKDKMEEDLIQPFIQVSKIYVGSRTHKQLSQLVGELKGNTRYRPKMAVLGSRDHYCIHGKVKKAADKGEACTQLLDDNLCTYSKNVRKMITDTSIRQGGDQEIWDIEDLTDLGRKKKGCPYFASRSLAETAEIIFCPYNYLLDPMVRSSLEIDLKDSVIILDEAHNIEDVARSCGSFELTEVQLKIVCIELSQVAKHPRIEKDQILSSAYSGLYSLADELLKFLQNDPKNTTIKRDTYEEHTRIWNNKDLLNQLSDLDITQISLKGILSNFQVVAEHIAKLKQGKEEENEQHDVHGNDVTTIDNSEEAKKRTRICISIKSLRFFEGLLMIFKFILSEEGTREKDYSMALIKKVERYNNNKALKQSEWEYKLAFWCLNPAIIFKDMTKDTRSVVLTSGTLSPLNTFASELETDFPIRLEANHVIDRSQVWIRSIAQGPGAVKLNGTWERASQFQYQDSVGESLCQISETIPYGILCFVPSYNAMEKLIERWHTTGVYDRLESKKYILCEPSGRNSKDLFESLMSRYYYYINEAETRQDTEGHKNGAILFAVYRGKVSEGIDFTDNNCRAVVALGIPFPNIKDIQVELKKDYNTKRYNNGEPVLDGGGWYRTQAYRAINQALGRCIRHRRDWGAVILLESRFSELKNISQLSKWVRPLCVTELDHLIAMADLREFAKTRLELDQVAKQEKLALMIKEEEEQDDIIIHLE